eukprot:CAMPEP_0194254998 /NCGR_PEP_ID=MMETSP0158-20130606/33387_1 /TAXON_ID=33649 /ORGANISM="Thalassionema nitzschioides, Strain L26-B" /LENGTH=49 /DNA_ID=CAMNT_0038993227 /DNA_START=152 /DNA_END=298 /DNA_ORIENTATION=+
MASNEDLLLVPTVDEPEQCVVPDRFEKLPASLPTPTRTMPRPRYDPKGH